MSHITEAPVVLKATGVKKYFAANAGLGKKKYVKAVDGVDIELHKGEIYGLVGETGCGKSTLGRTLMMLTEPTAGDIEILGQNVTELRGRELKDMRRKIQMVFQDPYTSLDPKQKVGDILMEALEIHGIGTKEERLEIAMDIMHKMGLRTEHFYRYPHEFSGGQRQRVGLARALILNPEIIVCDEPVSALDVSIQAQIINLLQDLREKQDISLLFIAHDMSVVKYISDRIGVMYLGHLMEEAEGETLFEDTLHPYSQALLSAVPEVNPHVHKERIMLEGDLPSPMNPPKGCVFHTRCPYAVERCSEVTPTLKEVRKGHRVACLRYENG
ncbi:oligopeptide/dipeptide ABC transporter, ATP-binding protein [Lachnospiraceae bacterium JC7]|nr:oligopeptide/dipeptide ABC transporter, ATP-binding protein [Lachnospiraceae bacterium JC7]